MSISDSSAHQVIQLLHRRGLKTPGPLQIQAEAPDKGTKNSLDWGSIYHHIACPVAGDIALALGFEDLD